LKNGRWECYECGSDMHLGFAIDAEKKMYYILRCDCGNQISRDEQLKKEQETERTAR